MTGARMALALLMALTVAAWAQDVPPVLRSPLLTRPARLVVRDEPLETALRRLSQGSGVAIAFSPDLVRGFRRVSCACMEATVGAALDTLLAGTGLRYEATGTRVIVAPPRPAPDTAPPGPADQSRATGTLHLLIRDAADDRPVHGASVLVAGRRSELRSDRDAQVRQQLPVGRYDLTVRALGYAPARRPVTIGPGTVDTVIIYLEPMAIPLSAIVVVPSTYGFLPDETVVRPEAFTQEEMRARPHGAEDIYRAINRVPGIATDDVSAKLHIRGSGSDQVLEVLDGVELFEPFHLKDQDGALSILDVESVGAVNVLTGGFPVEYGNKLAGVVAMRSAEPRPDRTTTTIALSLVNAMVNSQGGFAGGRGTWLASARRGYLDLVLDLTDALEEGVELSPRYYDVYGKVAYQLGNRHLLSAHGLWARDHFSIVEEDGTVLDSHYGSAYGWIQWRAQLTDALSATTTAATGRVTRERDGGDPLDPAFPDDRMRLSDTSAFTFVQGKQDWTLQFASRALARWGADVRHGRARYDYFRWHTVFEPNFTDPLGPPFYVSADTVAVAPRARGAEIGGYAGARVQPVPALTLDGGVRYDHQTHTATASLSPRVGAAVALPGGTTVRAAWGYYHQPHRIHELMAIDGDTTFYPTQRAEHRILSVEHAMADGTLVRLEGYERRVRDPRPEYRSLIPKYESLPEEGLEDRVRIAPTEGRARGLELFLKHDRSGQLAWYASYALAVAQDRIGDAWIPRPYDQRHTVRLEVAFRPGPGWSLAAAWQAHTGWPTTAQSFTLDTLATGDAVPVATWGPLNAERLPAYHRLDVRVARYFETRRGRIALFADVFNVYDRENAKAYDYDVSLFGNRLVVDRGVYGMIGILPSVGVRWEF